MDNNNESTQKTNTWDRSWTLQELRNETTTWTLASDAGLLHYLEEFSTKLISRTKELETDVDVLVFQAKTADVQVHNAFNEFLMLSNTQFIENRVYDDDEETVKPSEEKSVATTSVIDVQTMTPEQLEQILVPKYTSAITFGKDALSQITVEEDLNQEIADEENRPNKKQKKDPYSRHPLPSVIGTKDFYEDDYCGLFFEEEEEEEAEEEEEDEEIEEEEGQEEEEEESEEGEEEESEEEEDEEGEEISEGRKEAESREGEEESAKPVDSFASELAKKLGKRNQQGQPATETDSTAEESVNSQSTASRRKSSIKKEVLATTTEDLFKDFSDEEKDLFDTADGFLGISDSSRTKRHTLTFDDDLSKSGGLFDDIEGVSTTKDTSTSGSRRSTTTASLFFDEPTPTTTTTATSSAAPTANDSSSTERARSASSSKKKLPPGAVAMPGMPTTFNLFDSGDKAAPQGEDLFSALEKKDVSPRKVLPTPAAVDSAPTAAAASSRLSLFDDNAEDNSGSFLGVPTKKTPTSTANKPTVTVPKVASKSSLFDDADLSFAEPKKESSVTSKRVSSLFGEMDNEDAKPSVSSTKSSGGLFGTDETATIVTPTAVTAAPRKQTSKVSLFADTEEDSLFGDKPKAAAKTNPADSLFGEISSSSPVSQPPPQDELEKKVVPEKKLPPGAVAMPGMQPGAVTRKESSSKATTTKQPEKEQPKATPTTETRSSSSSSGLFEDLGLQKENLFDANDPFAVSASTVKPKTITPQKKTSLFGDDTEQDNASSTFFASTKEKKEVIKEKPTTSSLFDAFPAEEKKVQVPSATIEKKPPAQSLSLFGGEEDNSIFGATKETSASSKPVAKSSLFGDDTESVSLFGGSNSLKPKEKVEEKVTPTKTPSVSSVSLSAESNPLFAEPLAVEKPQIAAPTTTTTTTTAAKEEEAKNVSAKVSKGSNRIAALQNQLALDPSKMLGGAPIRKRQDSSGEPVQDDNSVGSSDETTQSPRSEKSSPREETAAPVSETGKLTSLTKSRPMASGRRLPSRHKNKGSTPSAKPLAIVEKPVVAATSTSTKSEPTVQESVSILDFKSSKPATTESKSTSRPSSTLFEDSVPPTTSNVAASIFDDIPAPTRAKSNSKPIATPVVTPSAPVVAVPETPKEEPKPTTTAVKKETPTVKSDNKPKAASSSIFDDLLSGTAPTPDPKPVSTPPVVAAIPTEEAVQTPAVQSEKKKETKEKKSVDSNAAFADIFGDPLASKKKPEVEKKAPPSIFDDPLEKKPKVAAKKKAPPPSIFD